MAYTEAKFKNEFGAEIKVSLATCNIRGHAGVLMTMVGPDSRMENAITQHEFEYLVSMGGPFLVKIEAESR